MLLPKSTIAAGAQDSTAMKYVNKVKLNLVLVLAMSCIASIFFISFFKYNPYFTFRYAKMQAVYAYDLLESKFRVGEARGASAEKAGTVPILYYSALNSGPDSISAQKFKNQMMALKDAGFQAVSLADLENFMAGRKDLPARSFLLTFDNSRKDSYYSADPVLKVLGYRAVMFVLPDSSLVDEHSFHLSRHELMQMKATGRWDIGVDGSQILKDYFVGQADKLEKIFNHKIWLLDQGKSEVSSLIAAKINARLADSKNKLEKELQLPMSSLAMQFNDAGDRENDYAFLFSMVRKQAAKLYASAFTDFWPKTKDGFSAACPSRDQIQNLKRINVQPDWSESDVRSILLAGEEKKLPFAMQEGSQKDWINLSGSTSLADNELELSSSKGIYNAYMDGGYLLRDYSFNAQVRQFLPGQTLSLMFRYADSDNYASCDYRVNSVSIKQVVDSSQQNIDEIRITQKYQIKKGTVIGVSVKGSQVQCLLDGMPVISRDQVQMPKSGSLGIKIWDKNQKDNLTKLADLKIYPDTQDWDTVDIESGQELVYGFLDQGQLESADLMLQDIYKIERYGSAKIARPIDWQIDPYNEEYWRFLFYSLQPTRHLIFAWQKTGNSSYKDKAVEIMESFIDNGIDGPFSWDKHGAAYRTMVLVNIAGKLKKSGALPLALENKVNKALLRHGNFLSELRNYEGDYNHGFDQAIALFVLSRNYPDQPQADIWRSISISRLDQGLKSIIGRDGILVENSPYYHFYALGKYWELYQYLQKNHIKINDDFDQELARKLRMMISYGARVLQPDLHVPTIGASLDTKVNYAGQYKEMGKLDPHFQYVLTKGLEGSQPVDKYVFYPDAGQTIMRSGWQHNGYSDQAQMIFDVGKYRTNHSDLDALSFSLYGQGRALMPDSGLYTYEKGPFRDYFHGTRSHNTVVVDGKSQDSGEAAKLSGRADVGQVGAGQLKGGENYAFQTAWHTLYSGVTHNRSLALFEDKAVLVIDYLDSDAEHRYEQMFHLFPGAKIERQGGDTLLVRDEKNRLAMRIIQLIGAQSMDIEAKINDTKTGEGLCSSAYEKAVPCYQLSYAKRGKSASYAALIILGEGSQVKYSISANDSILAVDTGGKKYSASLYRVGEKQRSVTVEKKYKYSLDAYRPGILDDMSKIENWTKTNESGSEGSIASASGERGERALRITNPSDVTYVNATKKVQLDMSDKNIYFKMRVPERIYLNTAQAYFSNDNFKNFAMIDIKYQFIPDSYGNQWVDIGLGKGEKRSTKHGNYFFYKPGFDWSHIDNIRFRTSTKSGSHDIYIGPIKSFEKAGSAKAVIMFDDGWSSVMDAARVMDKYGLKGNVGVIGVSVGKKSYLTIDQLKELQNKYGWDVVSHSYYHKDAVEAYFKNNDAAGYENDIVDNIYYLQKNGINSAPNWFIYPFGRNNEWTRKIVSKYYTFARGTQNAPEFFPYSDPLAVKVLSVYSDRIKPDGVIAAVRDAKKFDQTLFLMFHKFSEREPSQYTEFSLQEFEHIIRGIKSENIDIMTLSELDDYCHIGQNTFKISEKQPAKLIVNIVPAK